MREGERERRRRFEVLFASYSSDIVGPEAGAPGSGGGRPRRRRLGRVSAVEQAATVTAAAAERSGTAVVRITHNGKPAPVAPASARP
jgi:hypothetical protein